MTVQMKEIGVGNKEKTEVRDRAERHVQGAGDLRAIGIKESVKTLCCSELGG